jgi:hypothetical protein
MDDFNVSSLHESKNEWGARLLTILTPLLIEGFKSIFEESYKLCKENSETDKYLMTFQNFISRIPKWNTSIIETERKRIIDRSNCNYLEDLVTCIHIIQLKLLTAMRVGHKQKKIDINIPKIDDFIHKVYINVARKVYKNVYLFEMDVKPLQIQKYNRELELIVQECILNTVRDNIPVETILRAYMDETVEEDFIEEIKEQLIENPKEELLESTIITEGIKENFVDIRKELENESNNNTSDNNIINNSNNIDILGLNKDKTDNISLTFNDFDSVLSKNGKEEIIEAPKTIERLEEISVIRNNQRKLDEEEDENEDKLIISNEEVSLDNLDVHIIKPPNIKLEPDLLLSEIEVLA